MMIVPVVLSGGVGTRLWPRSRHTMPKQFLNLTSDTATLLQQTILRVSNKDYFTAPMVVCNKEHKSLLQANCSALHIQPMEVILEPFGKNTAPAIAAAAHWLQQTHGDDTMMLILPADHRIEGEQVFLETVKRAAAAAKEGKLVTFGVTPTHAATGYGYIERGDQLKGHEGLYQVSQFVEKPNAERAATLAKDNRYSWNSGMFIMKVGAYLQELQRFEPDIYNHVKEALAKGDRESNYTLLDEEHFGLSPEQSIDYGVMERTQNAAIAPLNLEWNDVGSWKAVYDIMHKDEDGNSTYGDVIIQDSEHCYAYAEHGLLTLVGVDNLVIASTQDATLVAHKDRTEEVKELVNVLRTAKRREFYAATKVYRPWGFYEELNEAPNYRVKRLVVNPGQKISLQFHRQRSEHWVVVSGIATVTHNERVYQLAVGESTYIHVGEHHRLENQHTTPLEIIEVQTGSYVGEDDIVRLEDVYGRVKPTLTK